MNRLKITLKTAFKLRYMLLNLSTLSFLFRIYYDTFFNKNILFFVYIRFKSLLFKVYFF